VPDQPDDLRSVISMIRVLPRFIGAASVSRRSAFNGSWPRNRPPSLSVHWAAVV